MRFKLTRFDKDLATLVKNSLADLPGIIARMNVDEADFRARLETLVDKGYFVFNRESNTLKLGWQGYNMFAPKTRVKQQALPKPLAEDKDKEKEREKERLQAQQKQNIQPSHPNIENFPSKEQTKPNAPAEPPVQILPSPQSAEDLADLLRKGAPPNGLQTNRKGSYFTDRQASQTAGKQPPSGEKTVFKSPDTGKPLEVEGVEACELCKAKFKLNVKNAEGAKYGHCFCGAAFHLDCHDSITENGGSCVRCGRKLKLMFDRKAEEAVKGIKDAFD